MSESRARSPRGRWSLARLGWILFAQVLLLVFLVEVVLRFAPFPGITRNELDPPAVASEEFRRLGPHPYLALAPKPGWRSEPGRKKQASHNSLGFRGEELGWEKPAHTVRIVCMGGSSTYGNGPSSDRQTWPSRLESYLAHRRPGQRFEVINAGAPTWSTFETLANLAFRVIDLDPDLVIVYHATNDASPALWPDPVPDNTHYRRTWPIVQPSPLEPYLDWSMIYLLWRAYCTDYLQELMDVGHKTLENYVPGYEDPYGDGPLPDQGFLNYERNLISIISLARGHGIPILFMTQALFSDDTRNFTHGRNRRRAVERLTDILRDVTAEQGVPLVDVKGHLEGLAAEQLEETGEQAIFTESVHLTNAGANELAKYLSRRLFEQGIIP